MEIRKQDEEKFKKNAVRLSNTSPRPVREIAKDIGIHEDVLYNWRRKYTAEGDKMKHATLEEENRDLQRQLRIKYGEILYPVNDKESYKEFRKEEDAENWGIEHYSEWGKKYKNMMQMVDNILKQTTLTQVLETYCGYDHMPINKYLRNKKNSDYSRECAMSEMLLMIICSAPPIPENIVVYRMVSDMFIKSFILENKNEIATPIQEKGFLSTSLLKRIANHNEPYSFDNNILKIYVKKGTLGIFVNSVAPRAEEEILLVPNMYLGMASYPYLDNETGKSIFECSLIDYHHKGSFIQ